MAERREILAGAAFARALDENPAARAAWERARLRLQLFGQALHATGVAEEREKAAREFTEAIREALHAVGRELEAVGFEAPRTIEEWEELAHIVGMPFEIVRSGGYTLADVQMLALAWAKRQHLTAKLRGDTVFGNGITVTDAACLLMRDVSDLDLERAKARVSKAATAGHFKTNGKTGAGRRIDPDTFSAWRLEQREKDLDEAD